MARYRQTGRVGRGATTATPTPTPTPTPTISKKPNIFNTIDNRITSSLPDIGDINADITIDEYLASLSDTQKRVIAEMLRKARYTIKKIDDVDDIISSEFAGLEIGSFNKFISSLNSQLVYKPSAAAGPSESISITQYGPEQIDAWVDDWLTKRVGRTLESVDTTQADLLREAVKDYASSESITKVTKDKKGRPVTTYKPGMSQAGIAETLETAAGEAFAPEMERRQAFEFGDILSKTLGIGAI